MIPKIKKMERELLLAVKDKNFSQQRVDREIEVMKKMLPFIESYDTFKINSEVFDIHEHKIIKSNHRMKDLFDLGTENNSRYYIISKN